VIWVKAVAGTNMLEAIEDAPIPTPRPAVAPTKREALTFCQGSKLSVTILISDSVNVSWLV
jgi:hypothetical protein